MKQMQQVTTKNQHEPCNCGCAECSSVTCQLDCLVQPRFFHGQVLSDQDLTQLLNWTQSKLRLNRFHDGWGVVCGMEVRCDCDLKHPGSVVVSPGYALSGCGDDLILCQELCVDISEVFKDSKSDCEKPRRSTQTNQPLPIPISLPLSDLAQIDAYIVDLYAHYEEEGSSPQTAFGRSNCRDLNQCENSRTKEVVRIIPKLVDTRSDPHKTPENMWRQHVEDYRNRIRGLRQSIERYTNDPIELKRQFLDWLAKHPLNHFCFVADWVNNLDANPVSIEKQIRAAEEMRDRLEIQRKDMEFQIQKAKEENNHILGYDLDLLVKSLEDQLKAAYERVFSLRDKQMKLAGLQDQLIKNPENKQEIEQNIREIMANSPSGASFLDEVMTAVCWIALDMLIAELQCTCGSFKSDEADVPLARVWVRAVTDRTGKHYRVLAVDDQPPYRRLLKVDCLPLPPGKHNLGHLFWRHKDDVRAELARLGIRMDAPPSGEVVGLRLLDQLERLTADDLWMTAGDAVKALWVSDPLYGDRVVGFER